jgi:hypothetical protein
LHNLVVIVSELLQLFKSSRSEVVNQQPFVFDPEPFALIFVGVRDGPPVLVTPAESVFAAADD